MGVENYKHLLIYAPKCMELNSKSNPNWFWFWGFGLGVTQHIVFLVGCLGIAEHGLKRQKK